MSAEEDRTKESATVLAKVSTAAFPAESLAPWMSHYDKKTQAVIVGTKTIADIAEELDRQEFMYLHPEENGKKEAAQESEDGEMFDTSKLSGGAYMMAFCLNRLAINMHNFAPSVDGIRTRQAIALAKANNPGVAAQPNEKKKRSLFDKILGKNKAQET